MNEYEITHKQHHHWGITEHGVRQLVVSTQIVDEYLYEFSSVEEVLEALVGTKTAEDLLRDEGGWLLTDSQSVHRQCHNIEIWAYHADPRKLLLYTLRCEKTTQ
jgi:hypothetical protein